MWLKLNDVLFFCVIQDDRPPLHYDHQVSPNRSNFLLGNRTQIREMSSTKEFTMVLKFCSTSTHDCEIIELVPSLCLLHLTRFTTCSMCVPCLMPKVRQNQSQNHEFVYIFLRHHINHCSEYPCITATTIDRRLENTFPVLNNILYIEHQSNLRFTEQFGTYDLYHFCFFSPVQVILRVFYVLPQKMKKVVKALARQPPLRSSLNSKWAPDYNVF